MVSNLKDIPIDGVKFVPTELFKPAGSMFKVQCSTSEPE